MVIALPVEIPNKIPFSRDFWIASAVSFRFVTTTESLQEILDNSPQYTNLDVNDENLEQHWLPEEEEFLASIPEEKMQTPVLQTGTKYTNDYWTQFGQDMVAYCLGEMEANDILKNMDANRAESAELVGDPAWVEAE